MFVCALSKQRVGSKGETVIDIGIGQLCSGISPSLVVLLLLPVCRDGRGGHILHSGRRNQSQNEGLQIVEGRAHGDGPTLVGTVSGCFCISHIDVIEPNG